MRTTVCKGHRPSHFCWREALGPERGKLCAAVLSAFDEARLSREVIRRGSLVIAHAASTSRSLSLLPIARGGESGSAPKSRREATLTAEPDR